MSEELRRYEFDKLEVIGFASSLGDSTKYELPRTLAPLYRYNGATLLHSPQAELKDCMLGAVITTDAEVKEWIWKNKMTMLEEPFEVEYRHQLWVAPSRHVHYTSGKMRLKTWKSLYGSFMEEARAHLARRRKQEAYHEAMVARAMFPGKLEPLLIRGAVELDDTALNAYEFTRSIAQDIVEPELFDQLAQALVQTFSEIKKDGNNDTYSG